MADNYDHLNIECLRCNSKMEFIGKKKFHEGTNWTSWVGEWGALLNRKEHFDIIGCRTCGKLEFFIEDSIKEYINL